MEQLTKNQAVATSQEAVQNQNEPQLRDENAHNDKSVDRKSGSAGMPRPISYAVFCLKKKNTLFRLRETDDPGSQIGRNPKNLLADVARRNHRHACVSGKFPRRARRLRVGPIPDGTRLRCGYHVSRFENVAIASGQGILLLPLQFEVLRENSWGGLGVCNLCVCVDWIERAQRLGALSRVSGQSRLPENSAARRAGPCAG